jgi:serine/threonine protein kinase
MDCARGTLADIIQEHGVISKEHQDIPATSPSPLSTPPPSSSWLQTATRLAYQTLQAIEYIHKNEVIHCDIKPDNLLLSVQGRVQLCDFGSAVDLALRTANQDTPEPWRTAVPRGTSEYASPELLRGREDLTVETDLWSFGCVLFALFCSGRSPFYASSDALAVEKIVTFNIATSDILSSSHLPPVWKNLISVLLQQDPPRRWIDTTCASWASPSGLGVAPRPTALSDRYRSIKQHPIWGGVDCLEKALPDLLSKNMALMDEPFEALRDGKIGWSAFA